MLSPAQSLLVPVLLRFTPARYDPQSPLPPRAPEDSPLSRSGSRSACSLGSQLTMSASTW